MGKRIVVVSLLALFFCHLMPSASYPDSAEVLPKGVFRGSINSLLFFPYDERYDPDGEEEKLAADFNRRLDSSVFPDLRLVEIVFAMPEGSANIGNSVVSFDYRLYQFEFRFQYGVTDRLTAGIMIPYYFRENNVDATVDTTNATVGKNAALNTLAPLTVPGTVPLTDEDVRALLGAGLDINGDGTIDISGYGYKRFESWSENGIGDIEVGGRYQYYKSEKWRLAFTGGVRFPTGEVDDPDNLVDRAFGSGAWALLFNFNHDYIGIKNLVLNATFRYDLVLPDKERLRVLEDVNQPLTPNKEKVDRDRGDLFRLYLSGTYQVLEGLSLSLLYRFSYVTKTDVDGDLGFNYESLEDETRAREHVGKITLTYSTIPLYRKKKFPVPLAASISYFNRFAGKNWLKTDYIGVDLGVFF